MRLQQNMRLGKNQELYRAYIRRIANGSINDSMERTELPESMCLFDREDLVKFVFPDYLLKDPLKEENWKKLTGRAILTPLNIDTLSLNNTLMVIHIYFFKKFISVLIGSIQWPRASLHRGHSSGAECDWS